MRAPLSGHLESHAGKYSIVGESLILTLRLKNSSNSFSEGIACRSHTIKLALMLCELVIIQGSRKPDLIGVAIITTPTNHTTCLFK